VTRRRRELSGEAWDSHRIILSWEDVTDSLVQRGDGYNVVLHEFAHYLDAEGRGLAPVDLADARGAATLRARTQQWNRGMTEEYEAFCEAVERGDETFLDPYAAEDESEFLAVATEDFVECGADLRDARPRLYALLREYYGIDPARWSAEARARDGTV
jgi:Mlc titration factor MtfA (ptsG expression regulator)